MEKRVHVLYDQWDNTKKQPIYNGVNFFGKNIHDDSYLIFDYYINHRKSEKNKRELIKSSLFDLNNDDIFLYGITIRIVGLEGVVNENLAISNELIQKIKEYPNLYVFYIDQYESNTFDSFQKFVNIIKTYNLPEEQFILLTNNSLLEKHKEKLNTKIKCKTIDFLPISSVHNLIINGGSEHQLIKKEKFFTCFNRGFRKHRVAIILLLKKYNLLDDVNWSFIERNNINHEYLFEILGKEQSYNFVDEIKFFNSLDVKLNDYESKLFNNRKEFLDLSFVPETAKNYNDSYINITTETIYDSKNEIIQITEKSFKPFFNYQIPIIVASHGHIRELKNQYNFDFYDDLIDHTYDDEIDDIKRLELIIRELVNIHKKKQDVIDYYKKNQHRFIQNKEKVLSIISMNKCVKFFEDLIDGN